MSLCCGSDPDYDTGPYKISPVAGTVVHASFHILGACWLEHPEGLKHTGLQPSCTEAAAGLYVCIYNTYTYIPTAFLIQI